MFSPCSSAFVQIIKKGKDLDKTMVSMIFGITCFSLFFSLVGTVLGGIWADQSWGRFWGWDAKENGALAHCDMERNSSARSLGRHCQSSWIVRTRYFWECGYGMVLVWNQYAWSRITLLWIYGQSLRAPDGIYWFTGCNNWNCLLACFFLFVWFQKRTNCLIIFQNLTAWLFDPPSPVLFP